MDYSIQLDVVDWSEHNDKSLTEHWNNDSRSFIKIPKGKGHPWYKVFHRGKYYQLYTDFTFSKISSKSIEEVVMYNGKPYPMKEFLFNDSWDKIFKILQKICEVGSTSIFGKTLKSTYEITGNNFVLHFSKQNDLNVLIDIGVKNKNPDRLVVGEYIYKKISSDKINTINIVYMGIITFINWYFEKIKNDD